MGITPNKHCGIPAGCGPGLSRYGFYPCGAGAGVDRIFGLGLGVLHLADLEKAMTELRLCALCGHAHGRKAKNLPGMSQSWWDAYAAYHRQPPTLPLYGAATNPQQISQERD